MTLGGRRAVLVDEAVEGAALSAGGGGGARGSSSTTYLRAPEDQRARTVLCGRAGEGSLMDLFAVHLLPPLMAQALGLLRDKDSLLNDVARIGPHDDEQHVRVVQERERLLGIEGDGFGGAHDDLVRFWL